MMTTLKSRVINNDFRNKEVDQKKLLKTKIIKKNGTNTSKSRLS